MKKILPSILLFLSSILLFGCVNGIETASSTKKKAPDVDKTTSGIAISIKKYSEDETYFNIYRKSDGDNVVRNICYTDVAKFESTNSAYIYEDIYLTNTVNYQYMVRYHLKDGTYISTEWSDQIKASASNATTYSFSGTNAKLSYYKDNKTLKLSEGSITAPTDTSFKPVIALSNGSETQVFEMSSTYEIDLGDVLPDAFKNVTLTVEGIVGQKNILANESDDTSIKRVIWTDICKLPVKSSNTSDTYTITVSRSQNSDGYDYSLPTD